MVAKISPSFLSGSINAPASKSSMQRACAAALLHKGVSHIYNAGISNDDKAALNIIKQLGATVSLKQDFIEIDSTNFNATILSETTINCGESGLSIRMFAPIAALLSNTVILVGEGSLKSRPMDFFDEVFPMLEVEISSDNGKLPLKITGPLQPQNITIDGSLSSQFLTGLLLSFGASATEELIITVRDLKSKPYIDLTLDVMQHFGYSFVHDDYKRFIINPKKNNSEQVIKYQVEADWSSASFLLVAGAIAGDIKISGLSFSSTQADRAIMEVLQICNAKMEVGENQIKINKSDLKSFDFDATDCPDLFPPLAILASCCNGKSYIKGIHRLAAKESNRAESIRDILTKMNVAISIEDDKMVILGSPINGAELSSHHDHRIAMASAIAGLVSTDEVCINDADAINKSYPNFYEDLIKLNGKIQFS